MVIKSTGYNIYTSNAFTRLRAWLDKKSYSEIFILCDENTMAGCLAILLANVPALAEAEVIETESGEKNKALEVCAGIWQTMIEQNTSREALLVNLGGGVICDMGGFCGAVYKRGIDFIHVPTTLLAMVDASVGGKTAVDLGASKNMIGCFAHPRAVFVEKTFLHSLSARHYYNGLAEVFKIALVADAGLLSYLDKHGGTADMQKLINSCIKLKNNIVAKDPSDKALRKILNFGHTIGHAVESMALQHNIDLLHGEAVIAGIIMESHISLQKKMLSEQDLIAIVSLLMGHYSKLSFEPLPGELEQFLRNDKKNKGTQNLFSLITRPGNCKWDIPVNMKEIKKALEFYNSLQYAEN